MWNIWIVLPTAHTLPPTNHPYSYPLYCLNNLSVWTLSAIIILLLPKERLYIFQLLLYYIKMWQFLLVTVEEKPTHLNSKEFANINNNNNNNNNFFLTQLLTTRYQGKEKVPNNGLFQK